MQEVLSNIEVVLFALYKLGGVNQKIHTEKIAFECFNLAREKFSWRLSEYKNYPDKTPVRFALEQAKKKENDSLVIGKAGGDFSKEREGWQFTQNGVKWIQDNGQRIAKALNQERPELLQREVDRFKKRMKNDFSFITYKKDGNLNNVSKYNFSDLLNCLPDGDIDIMHQKFETLRSTALLVKEKDIIDFLNQCEEKFLKPI